MGPGVDIKRTNMDSRSMYTPTLSVTPLPPHGGGTHKTKQPPEKATGPRPGGTGDADAKGPRATTHAQGGAQARPRTPQASTTHSRPLIVRTHSAGVVASATAPLIVSTLHSAGVVPKCNELAGPRGPIGRGPPTVQRDSCGGRCGGDS